MNRKSGGGRKWLRSSAMQLLIVGVLLICAGSNRRNLPPSPDVLGAYRVEFRGTLSGSGNATVNPNSVTINALIRDEIGNTGSFIAPNLPLNRGRFSGSGTAMGLPVQVSGRIDSPADTLKTARLVCSFDTPQGRSGRALGIKREPVVVRP